MAGLIFSYLITFFIITTGEDMDINSLFMTQTKFSLYYYSKGYNKKTTRIISHEKFCWPFYYTKQSTKCLNDIYKLK